MEIDTGDTAWLLAGSALVLLMTPGLAFFYGGMVRMKSVLNMIMMSFACIGVVRHPVGRLRLLAHVHRHQPVHRHVRGRRAVRHDRRGERYDPGLAFVAFQLAVRDHHPL